MNESNQCLDSNLIVDLLAARVAEPMASGARLHLDRCDRCRQLLTAVTICSRSTAEDAVTEPQLADASELPALGSMIARYQVRRLVGYGGMGMVYAAHDPKLDRMVALKLLRPNSESIETTQAALERESRIMAGLTSSNVATIYDVGEWRGQIYIALEFAEGGNLQDWLRAGRTWQQVRDAFVAAGSGLAAGHNVGVIHGDFKPDNVLMTKDGEVRVADFGLARITGDLRGEGIEPKADFQAESDSRTIALVGTPAYMAPEQHRGSPATVLSDQFSFAVALYEALYRVRPFVADSVAELAKVVQSSEPAPPTKANVPGWLFSVVRRGLQADPQKRYPTMHALLADLERPRSNPWLLRGFVVALIGSLLVALLVVRNRNAALEQSERDFNLGALLTTSAMTADAAPNRGDEKITFPSLAGSCSAMTELRPRGFCMSMNALGLLGVPETYAASAALASEAIKVFEELHGGDHCDMMFALIVRSQALLESAPARAEKDIAKVLEVCTDGTDDDVAGLKVMWAETLVELERFSDAEDALEQVNPDILDEEDRNTLVKVKRAIKANKAAK